MAEKREAIEVVVNDAAAQKALDTLLDKLQKAKDLGGAIGLGGGGGSGRGGDRGGGGQVGGEQGSTAKGQRQQIEGYADGMSLTRGADLAIGATQTLLGGGAGGPARAMGQLVKSAAEQFQKALIAETSRAMEAGIENWASAFGDVPIVGDAVVALGKVYGSVFGTIGQAQEIAYGDTQTLAQLERPQQIAERVGGGNIGLDSAGIKRAAELGIGPEEATQTLGSYYQALGQYNSKEAVDPFKYQLSGIGIGAMTSYQSLSSTIGGGATTGLPGVANSLRGAVGVGEGQLGLRGVKVDEMLMRIASATSSMAEQGLSLDLNAVNKMASSLDRSSPAFEGMHGVKSGLKLSQIGQKGASSFASQFGGLTDTAMQAEAFGQTSDPLEAIKLMQQMSQDPEMVRQIIIKHLGPEAAGLAFAGSGFSGAQAQTLKGGLAPGVVTPSDGRGRAMPLAAETAKGRLRQLQTAKEVITPEMARTMVDTVTAIHDVMLQLSEKTEYYQRAVNAMLKGVAWVL